MCAFIAGFCFIFSAPTAKGHSYLCNRPMPNYCDTLMIRYASNASAIEELCLILTEPDGNGSRGVARNLFGGYKSFWGG